VTGPGESTPDEFSGFVVDALQGSPAPDPNHVEAGKQLWELRIVGEELGRLVSDSAEMPLAGVRRDVVATATGISCTRSKHARCRCAWTRPAACEARSWALSRFRPSWLGSIGDGRSRLVRTDDSSVYFPLGRSE